MMQGMQFCKYPDFYCPYKGDKYQMTAKLGQQEVTGVVTYCNLNKLEGIITENNKKQN
jgi:hypothetical protein